MAIGYEPEVSQDAPPTGEELIASLPKTIQVSLRDGQLDIREDWFRWRHAVLLVAIMVLVSGPVTIYLKMGSRSFDTTDEISGVIGVALACLMGTLAYGALAGLVNSTRIIATGDRLRKSIGPLPWLGYVDVAAGDIDQIYVIRKLRRQQRTTPWDWDDDVTSRNQSFGGFSLRKYKTVPYFKLVVRLNGGRVHSLSTSYDHPYAPRILEHFLEAQLGIEDRVVADEALN